MAALKDPIRILTFSTLYPNEVQPNHGIFVENRLRHLVGSGAVEAVVVAPVPYFPSGSRVFGRWSDYARVPKAERRNGLIVHHPRYPVVPKIGMNLAPANLAAGSLPTIRRLCRDGHAFDLIDAHFVYPLAKAAGIITVSQALKDATIQLGMAPDDVAVLRNGVDLKRFRPMDRCQARAQLAVDGITLLSVGHLIERKGHDLVIRALAELTDCQLIIVGEGPERGRLEALATALGVASRVRLVGAKPHDEMAQYYSAADALVLASSREGWANVLLEAMACADRKATRQYAEKFSWDETTRGQFELFGQILSRTQGGAAHGLRR